MRGVPGGEEPGGHRRERRAGLLHVHPDPASDGDGDQGEVLAVGEAEPDVAVVPAISGRPQRPISKRNSRGSVGT